MRAKQHFIKDHNAEALKKVPRISKRLPKSFLKAIKGKRKLGEHIKWTEEGLENLVRYISNNKPPRGKFPRRVRVKREVVQGATGYIYSRTVPEAGQH